MPLRVKICGITNLQDALAAVDAGADALGFMFYDRSKRSVASDVVAKISRELPPFILRVGVFVDASPDAIRRTAETCGLTALQFHGSESPEFCAQFNLPVIKAFRLADQTSLDGLSAYRTNAWLLDSAVPDQLGGTGQTGDWGLARAATKLGRPVILAGGLTPENVKQAVREVGPYGVDVSSGVESSPGRKDSQRLKLFVRSAREGEILN
jgi:phosphoribosylanthranilate isomerase